MVHTVWKIKNFSPTNWNFLFRTEPQIVDVFHSYVRPVINPKLSEFCKSLTGIDQETVDRSDVFEDVLKKFEVWMAKHGLGVSKTFILITDGPFDMGRFMYLQCKYSEISYPEYGCYWANLRKLFVNFYKASFYSNNNHSMQLPGLQTMLSRLGKCRKILEITHLKYAISNFL